MTQTLTVQNFKGCRYAQLSPSGPLVIVAGDNGAGKSSFIDAFTELFDPQGVRLTPEPIRHGESRATVSFEDTDLGVCITRTWRRNDAGRLEVAALDGAKYSKPAEVIAKLIGGVIFDPSEFLTLDERRQRDALLRMVDLPFDLDEIERERKSAYDARTEAGREVTRLRGAVALATVPPEDVANEEVPTQDILSQIQDAQDRECARAAAANRHAAASARVEDIERQIARLRDEKHDAVQVRDLAQAALSALPSPKVSVDELRATLASVEDTNRAVRAQHAYQQLRDSLDRAITTWEATTARLEGIEATKRDGLAAARFPVAGLAITDDGLTFENVPFSQVNRAAQLRVAFAIATAGAPDLRLVIVKEGDLLDSASVEWVRSLAEERGYTVLMERDRDESRQIGSTIVDGRVEGATAPAPKTTVAARRQRVENCRTCAAPGIVPPHEASAACISGSRTHCSCEACF